MVQFSVLFALVGIFGQLKVDEGDFLIMSVFFLFLFLMLFEGITRSLICNFEKIVNPQFPFFRFRATRTDVKSTKTVDYLKARMQCKRNSSSIYF